MNSKKVRADLANQRFGKLIAEYILPFKINGSIVWSCACDCGNRCEVAAHALLSGNNRSCGCLRKEVLAKRPKTLVTKCPHTDKKHYAYGVCANCYRSLYRGEQSREYSRQYHIKVKKELGPHGYKKYLQKSFLKRLYKLSLEQFNDLKNSQDNKCPCGRNFTDYVPQVDHDHSCCPGNESCGKCVRGLLCQRCNMVAGMLEEDPRLLPQYLWEYLNV